MSQPVQTTLQQIYHFGGKIQHEFLYTPLILLLSTIYYLPYLARKHLLDGCRIQRSQFTNSTLLTGYNLVVEKFTIIYLPGHLIQRIFDSSRGTGHPYTGLTQKERSLRYIPISYILDLFEHLYDSPLQCSVLSYFVRGEVTKYPEQFNSVGNEQIWKEMKASQQLNLDQELQYRGLFTDELLPIHKEVAYLPRLTQYMFTKHMKHFVETYTDESKIIYPHYNKHKNVAYETQRNYYIALQGDNGDDDHSITSFDLLVLYEKTGIITQGPLELRTVWRFNVLKPRLYYCLGGTAFFAALYIKDIVTTILEAFPSTHKFTRYTVTRIQAITASELLVTYDYSSFTTSLAELKYFMTSLAHFLEGVIVQVLDVRNGLTDIDLGTYLHHYNEVVNMHGEIDLSRLFRGDVPKLYQQRSGSLGVGGNIGFSGLVHGIALGGITDRPDEDSVVGDDALTKILYEQLDLTINLVNKLGVIASEKFTLMGLPETHKDLVKDAFKYLKRPLAVNLDGSISVGTLSEFPNISQALFPEGDGVHSVSHSPIESIVSTFISQVGRFLSLIQRDLGEDLGSISFDRSWILYAFGAVYNKYRLPKGGSYPGIGLYEEASDIYGILSRTMWIPPVDTDEVFSIPWLEVLHSRFAQETVTFPSRVEGFIPLPRDPVIGQTYVSTMTGSLVGIMEDFGYIEKHLVSTQRIFNEYLVEEVTLMLGLGYTRIGSHLKLLYQITFLDIPHYYFDVLERISDPDEVFDGDKTDRLRSASGINTRENIESDVESDYGSMEY